MNWKELYEKYGVKSKSSKMKWLILITIGVIIIGASIVVFFYLQSGEIKCGLSDGICPINCDYNEDVDCKKYPNESENNFTDDTDRYTTPNTTQTTKNETNKTIENETSNETNTTILLSCIESGDKANNKLCDSRYYSCTSVLESNDSIYPDICCDNDCISKQEICKNAAAESICSGLDIGIEDGYRSMCCSDYGLCC